MTKHLVSRRTAFRVWAVIHAAAGLLGLSVFWPEAATAGQSLPEQLAGPAWAWSVAQAYDLPGARLEVRRFRTLDAPADAARRLTEASPPRFTRVQVLGPSLWLSGLQDGEHWMAHLRKHAGGTVGLVSSLVPLSDVPAPLAGLQALVPCPASQVIQMSSRDPAGATLLRVVCPGMATDVLAGLARHLHAARWEPADGPEPEAPGGMRDWQHSSGASLTVLSQQRTSGVWLTLWHRVPEPKS